MLLGPAARPLKWVLVTALASLLLAPLCHGECRVPCDAYTAAGLGLLVINCPLSVQA